MATIKMTTKPQDADATYTKRERAQIATYGFIQELLERNVNKTVNQAYSQYTKDAVTRYLQNPASNIDNIREVSRFLERHSMIYKKLMLYFATAPLFYYNLTQTNNWMEQIDKDKNIKNFIKVAEDLHNFNIRKEMPKAIYLAVRDGISVNYLCESNGHKWFLNLDPRYVRIAGRNYHGQYVAYFNASYFNGDNRIFVEGIDGDTSGCWAPVFVEGWNDYLEDKLNNQWFRLDDESTFVLLAGDDFKVPMPYFMPLFISMLQLLDYEQIMADKTELENYKLLINKIPLISSSSEIDDFAISLDIAKTFDQLMDGPLPELVAHVLSPGFETEVIDFENANSATDTDILSNATSNFFDNAGVSQLVVSGGSKQSATALRFAIQNDMANVWEFVNKIESWMNYYLQSHNAKNYIFGVHRVSWYNRDEYLTERKDMATLGGSALDWLTSCGMTPFEAWNQINFDNMLGLKDIMKPLQSSYTQSNKNGGRPQSDDGDLSDEGLRSRDEEKNKK